MNHPTLNANEPNIHRTKAPHNTPANSKRGSPAYAEPPLPRAHNRDRTGDLILTKDVLCQLSYVSDLHLQSDTGNHRAGDGTRTRDIKLGRLALYQLSYSRVPGSYPAVPNDGPAYGPAMVREGFEPSKACAVRFTV
jgi:hypothetical protein